MEKMVGVLAGSFLVIAAETIGKGEGHFGGRGATLEISPARRARFWL
jgi:hypothetical protein